MCLGVYLGTAHPITIPDAAPGSLGVEKASWTPPPLRRNRFVYFLGEKAPGADRLTCSCLLSEEVVWTEDGPIVSAQDNLPGDRCPFEVLRGLCDEATRHGGPATLVCDDGGGREQPCSDDDYCTEILVRLGLIARGNLLFADVSGGFPWRVLHVVR